MKGENKKIIILLPVLLLLAVIVVNVVSKNIGSSDEEIISVSSEKVSYEDVKSYLKKVDFNEQNTKEFFKDKIVNNYTLKYFKFLQSRFKDMELNEHLDAVKKYLNSSMDIKEADLLFALYQKYINYEAIMAEELSKIDSLNSTSDYLNVLRMMKKKQIEMFGQEDADILFGVSLKMKEYPVRRSAILNDNSIYADEKEKKLKVLNEEMWGKDWQNIESSRKPYVAYNEKLSLYSKDFEEMSAVEKNAKINQVRKEIFSQEIVERLENLDRELEAEKGREEEYREKYKSIMADASLKETDKQEKIASLQKEMFGENADLMRRREQIESGKIDLMREYKK
ncbi:MAG: lipase secretion chaperone [Spirochaetota bacterium]